MEPKILKAFKNGEGFDYIDSLFEDCEEVEEYSNKLYIEYLASLKDEKLAFSNFEDFDQDFMEI